MNLLRSFPLLCFALVLLSIGAVCLAQKSVQLFLVAGTLAGMSWFITEGPRGRTLPRWVSNVLVIGVAVNFFVDFFQHRDEPLAVLGRFAVFLVLIKLYERRTPRDSAQLLSLSLLLIITGCLQATDIIFGILLLAYCALGLYVLLLYQLFTAHEVHRAARMEMTPAGYRLVPPFRPAFGRHPSLHFRSQAAGIAAAGLALSLIVFLFFPRGFGPHLFGDFRLIPAQRVTQFTNRVDLISGTRINDRRTHVMTVQWIDAQGQPVQSAGPLLLRGAVVDRYDGNGRWSASSASTRTIHVAPGAIAPLANNANTHFWSDDPSVRIDFTRSQPTVFAPYAPLALATGVDMDLDYDPLRQTLRTSENSPRLTGYQVVFDPDPTPQTARDLTDGLIRPVRDSGWFPDGDGRVRELAQRILRQSQIDPVRVASPSRDWDLNRRIAAALTAHLRAGEYTYTLDLRGVRAGEADPIVNFLIESRRGHCEYFASALAAMCHSVGVPARIALGFVAHNYDELARQYDVLESNAHAWVEVMTGDGLWSSFDPTPPAALSQQPRADQATFAEQLRRILQRFEGNWTGSVIEFDSSSQRRLAESLNLNWSQRLGKALATIREWMARVNDLFLLGPAGYIWMGIVGLALLIAVIALVKLMRRSRAIHHLAALHHFRGSEYQRMLRHLGFYLDMLHVLKRGGIEKPPWQPPRQFAQQLESDWPAAALLVRRITDAFYEIRFGGRRPDSTRLAEARSLVVELAKTLRVRV
jgi:transglutaminase-like putative cysteine protease